MIGTTIILKKIKDRAVALSKPINLRWSFLVHILIQLPDFAIGKISQIVFR